MVVEWLSWLARADGVCYDFVDCAAEMGRLTVVTLLAVGTVIVCMGIVIRLVRPHL